MIIIVRDLRSCMPSGIPLCMDTGDFISSTSLLLMQILKSLLVQKHCFAGGAENMVWFRDYYRRNRDYSVLSTALIYILNVIDANVFAHFSHFDISDDITFNVHPDVITPELPSTGLYTYDPAYSNSKVGFTLDITF